VPTITQDTIRQLAGFRGDGAPVVSCYLDVDGRRHVRRPDVEAALDQLLRDLRDQPGSRAASRDLARIEQYVRDGLARSHTRGLAMFSCAEHDLFEVIALPVSVANRVVINNAPAIGPLEALVEELDRFGVLLLDQQRSRMFVFHFGELVDHSELFDAKPRQYDSLGEKDLAGYDKAAHHVDELVNQHLRHAADVAFQVFQRHGFERLTIGAPDDMLGTFEAMLHPYLRERICRPIDVAIGASVGAIRSAAMAVEAAVERDKEAELIGRLRSAVGSGHRGVAGLRDTLAALVERRVDILFVSQGYRETGWRCERCGHLCLRGPTCPIDGSQMMRVDDIVEEAIDIALAQSCRAEICVDNADLDVMGRIGALLRY
jgi:peptide subunit release factor 1 (eRF1)